MTGRAVGIGFIVVLSVLGLGASAPAAGDATVGTLAFDVPAEGYSTAYIVRTNGSGLRSLGPWKNEPEDPAWSPDGRRIAFADFLDLFVGNARGGTARRINIRDDDFYGHPRWSPDGKRIVYGRSKGIAITTLASSGHRVVRLRFRVEDPDWSPDGKKLAFVRQPFGYNEPGEIYTAKISGSDVRRITHNKRNEWDSEVRWSPDGRRLLFIRATSTDTQAVYTVSASGGRPLKLVSEMTGQYISSVSWSPDGKQIAYMAHPKIHIFTLATRQDRAFTPGPCRSVDRDRYESCDHVDWRWATP